MLIQIGGDTLALDRDIRTHIETEAAKLAARFPGEDLDARATIQEEFDPLHGHRVRCELSAKFAHGRQIVVRDACKTAKDAINQVFGVAHRNLRRSRRTITTPRIPCSRPATQDPVAPAVSAETVTWNPLAARPTDMTAAAAFPSGPNTAKARSRSGL